MGRCHPGNCYRWACRLVSAQRRRRCHAGPPIVTRSRAVALTLSTIAIVGAALAQEPAQPYRPGDTFRDCPHCPEMVVVPAGSFEMGSPSSEEGRYDNESPLHRVSIDAAFAFGIYEVTVAEWDACASAGGCGRRPKTWGRGSHPVTNISWNHAQEYVVWLSRETGRHYRLPSEAEWEYAARGGTRTRYWWGEDYGRGNANCKGCGSRWDNRRTAPAGSFAASPFGLYDVHGNVWEWVEDCYHDSYAGAPSRAVAWTGDADCSRVLRGGSWGNAPRMVRAANRERLPAGAFLSYFGVRVALTLD